MTPLERRERRLTQLRRWAEDTVRLSPHWMERDLPCNTGDAEKFFIPGAATNSPEAKAACRTCSVNMQCLATAFVREENAEHVYGLFGGLTARERNAVRKEVAEHGLASGGELVERYQLGIDTVQYRLLKAMRQSGGEQVS